MYFLLICIQFNMKKRNSTNERIQEKICDFNDINSNKNSNNFLLRYTTEPHVIYIVFF